MADRSDHASARHVRLNGTARASDGTRLAFQVDGPRHARPLLLLQGQANSHRWWRRPRAAFADDWLTVTFDYRGTGRTAADLEAGSAWTTAGFADDAAAVVSALGVDRPIDVYGTSMGGRVAQELALRHPAVVRRLVLGCTSPGGPDAVERDATVRRALIDPDPVRRRDATIDLFYTRSFVDQCGGYDGVPTDLLGDPLSAAAAARHLATSASHDASGRLQYISAPTLVMHGSDDHMVPTHNATLLAAGIPDSQLVLVEAGRHGYFDEFGATSTTTVRRFLTVADR